MKFGFQNESNIFLEKSIFYTEKSKKVFNSELGSTFDNLLKFKFSTDSINFKDSVKDYERYYPNLFNDEQFKFKIKIGLCILHSERIKQSLIYLDNVLHELLAMEVYKEHTTMPKNNEMAPDTREQLIHEFINIFKKLSFSIQENPNLPHHLDLRELCDYF